ncbi:MAG: DUF4097 family beta strand repeat protein [Oscillospiraceae bacterium]|nr:DUF4097 family beta strand repeat protein [Oscillospiraceae bacterium]
MRKITKIWLIIAVALIVIGGVIFAAILSQSNWDFTTLSTVNYQTKTYTSLEQFNDIAIETETADITFLFSENDSTKVVCYEMEKVPHSVSFDGGKLTIRDTDQRQWFDHIGISFVAPKITIYLPKSEYGALNISTTTGGIFIPQDFQFESIHISGTTGDIDSSATVSGAFTVKLTTGNISVKNAIIGSLDLTTTTGRTTLSDVTCSGDIRTNVSTGKVNLANIRCINFSTDGSTGDISLENVIADKQMIINRSTGDVKIKDSDANSLNIQLDTGNVTGNLLTGKIFTVESDTGKIRVPENSPGGICVITTSTGDILIS